MTNLERIKNMNTAEMVEFIDELSNSGEYTCDYCSHCDDEEGYCRNCESKRHNGVLNWLESEAEE